MKIGVDVTAQIEKIWQKNNFEKSMLAFHPET